MGENDLKYFKKLLEDLREETLEEINNEENIDANENYLPDDNDVASVQYEQSFRIKMTDRNRKFIKKIDKALKKIEDKTYGICEECDNEISIERLKARPVATLCIDCKIESEKEEESAN